MSVSVQFADMEKYSKVIVVRSTQHNAGWILCNIAGGTTASNTSVCNAGGMELFHKLLQTSDKQYLDVALYGLANIAGESQTNRNRLLDLGVLNTLLDKYSIAKEFELLESYGFLLKNIMRYPYEFNEQTVNDILEVSMQTLEISCCDSTTEEFIEGIGCLVSHNDYGKYVLSTEPYLSILLSYFNHTAYEIQEKVHRITAVIATGTTEMTQSLLNKRILDKALCLLHNAKPPLRKEIAWLVSNITAGTRDQIDEVLSHSIITSVMKLLIESDLNVKKEATYIFYNIAILASPNQILKLVSLGILEYLKDALNNSDPKYVLVISTQNMLTFTRALLKAGEDLQVDSLKFMMDSSGCIDVLEKLLNSQNSLISEKAYGIVRDFIGLDEDSDQEKQTLQLIESEFVFS